MSLKRQFFKYVIPSVLSMWIFALYTMVDGIFVSWGVNENALAAVNLSMPYVDFIFAVGILFATGTSTVVAIALGQNDRRSACRYFNQNLLVVSAVCILLSAVTLCNLEKICIFLGGGEDTLSYVKDYVGTIAPFAVFFAVSYNLEVQVKDDGSPLVSSIGVLSCGLMNILLDYVFVMRFHWGIQGAAFATGLAQVTSTAVFVLYFIFRRHRLQFGWFGLELSAYRRIIPLGLSEGLTDLSNGIVIFAFNIAIIRTLGAEMVTCYTVVSYVNTLVLSTMSGISQGIQPVTSFYFGAGKRDCCHRILRFGLAAVAICSAALFLPSELFAPGIVRMFLPESSRLFRYTVGALRTFGTSFLLAGFNILMSGYFTAVDLPQYAFPISIGRSLVLLLLSLAFCTLVLGGNWLWLAAAMSELLCLILTGMLTLCYCRRIRSREPDGIKK